MKKHVPRLIAAVLLFLSGSALIFAYQGQGQEPTPEKEHGNTDNHAGHSHKSVAAAEQSAGTVRTAKNGKTAAEKKRIKHERGGDRWGADFFPNVPLVTQDGEKVRFYDDLIKDKVIVMNFMYTSCADSCPMMTSRLKIVKEMLGDRVGEDVFMYSISIDPERDTPEALKAYKEKFNVGSDWTFLTGSREDVMLLRRKLGFYIILPEDGPHNHNMGMLMGNQRTGQWMKRSSMDNPYFIARQLGTWLTNWEAPEAANRNNYAETSGGGYEVPTMGQNLYRSRCMTCHTIGEGNVMQGRHRMGPDLLGVTKKRDQAWLKRWLKNPEAMLAEEDPVAMRLYEQYNNIIMPNLRLSETEINAVLDYIRDESQRVMEKRVADAEPESSGGHDHHKHHDHHNHQH